MQLPNDSDTGPLSIDPRDMKTYVHTKPYTWMSIAALFVIAQNCKQSRCFPMGEWLNKLWRIHTMEQYSPIKSSKLLIDTCNNLNLQSIRLSEKHQSQKITYCMWNQAGPCGALLGTKAFPGPPFLIWRIKASAYSIFPEFQRAYSNSY